MGFLAVVLGAEALATVGTDNTARHPSSLGATANSHTSRNLLDVRRPSAPSLRNTLHLLRVPFTRTGQRRDGAPLRLRAQHGIAAVAEHVRERAARVDRVDGAVLGQLARPHARHGLEGALGACVERQVGQARLGPRAGDVDDAARAVGGQVRLGGANEQDGTEDVGRVRLVEHVRGDAVHRAGQHDGGTVDDDVDLEFARFGVYGKLGLACLNQRFDALRGANVGAARHGGDVVLGRDLGGQVLGGAIRTLRQVADEDVGALFGKVAHNASADAFTR